MLSTVTKWVVHGYIYASKWYKTHLILNDVVKMGVVLISWNNLNSFLSRSLPTFGTYMAMTVNSYPSKSIVSLFWLIQLVFIFVKFEIAFHFAIVKESDFQILYYNNVKLLSFIWQTNWRWHPYLSTGQVKRTTNNTKQSR